MENKDSTATYPVGYQEQQISQPQPIQPQPLEVREVQYLVEDIYGPDVYPRYLVRQLVIGNPFIGWAKFDRFI